ncbi:hypothetical protein E4U61_004446 [Claviceps capensis]|nr:hypothetical protein E4U61_004446 [Claviceps capensis]
MVPYLDANWWPYRGRFVNYSTNKIMAYGEKAENDIYTLVKKMLNWWESGHDPNEELDRARRHFQSWIPENIKTRLWPVVTDLSDIRYNYLVDMTPRYKYCLYVDDLCIESLDQDGVPVVKILDKAWEPYTPEELKELEESEDLGAMADGSTPAPFHDGFTDDWEEDVGWIYMPVRYHLDRYFTLLKWD